MTNFEKVEKIVEKTGVSYEDAKAALESAGGDLLDAMIVLEKEGKVAGPKTATYSTQYEQQTQYVSVPSTVEQARQTNEESAGTKFKRGIKKLWHFLSTNFLIIKRHGELRAKLPLWGAALILLFAWHISLILIIISLFFGFGYSFIGEADLDAANKVMDKASNAAEKVKEEYNKL